MSSKTIFILDGWQAQDVEKVQWLLENAGKKL